MFEIQEKSVFFSDYLNVGGKRLLKNFRRRAKKIDLYLEKIPAVCRNYNLHVQRGIYGKLFLLKK